MRKLIDRLWPIRLRQKPELKPPERQRLFAQVADTNPCLLAVIDMMEDQLEGNFSVAINPDNSPEKRLLACDRMGIAYQNLQQIEDERARARRDAETQK